VLTRSGEPVERKMTEIPEPKDKLDATATVAVSGPEDDAERWRQIDWRRVEADVRRLRQRIFTASKAGDLQRVRRLQKLMLRSRANTLLSVRRVTERNAGRLTAGVDGEVVLIPEAKMQLVDRIQLLSAVRMRHGGAVEGRHRRVRYERRSNSGGSALRAVFALKAAGSGRLGVRRALRPGFALSL
jgi:hypothetical protein